MLKKGKLEIHKNAICYFEQNLEAAPPKKATERTLSFHLTKYPREFNKKHWELLGKKGLSRFLLKSNAWTLQS